MEPEEPHPRVAAGLRDGSLGQALPSRPAEAGQVVVMRMMMRRPRHGAGPIAEVCEENQTVGGAWFETALRASSP
jgi:hypothetical protein